MSRARMINDIVFDTKGSVRATVQQLELLADAENLNLDDLLDEGLTQGQAYHRIQAVLNSSVIPPEVLERRRLRKELAKGQPDCRICTLNGWQCEGSITRHHFIPRWLMLLLDNYEAYAARSKCTIPICVGRHRDLHYRNNDSDKSIITYLTVDEREFAQKMLDELRDERPAVFDLIAGGDSEYAYEAQLIRDYFAGEFRSMRDAYEIAVPERALATG